MDATRACATAEIVHLLPAGVAGDTNFGTPPRCGARASSWNKRAGDHCFESHHAAGRHRTDSGRSAGAVSSPAGPGNGRRDTAADAQTSAPVVVRKALGVSTGLPAGYAAFQRFSAAAIFRISAKLSLCGRIGRSRLLRADF